MIKFVWAIVNWGENLFVTLSRLLLKMPADTAVQAYRFLFAGVISAAAFMATLTASVEWLHMSPVLANIPAFIIGTAVSYLINTHWSFETEMSGETLFRFSVVTMIGFGLNLGLMYLMHDVLAWHYLIAGFIILVIVPIFNFIGHKIWTFKAI